VQLNRPVEQRKEKGYIKNIHFNYLLIVIFVNSYILIATPLLFYIELFYSL